MHENAPKTGFFARHRLKVVAGGVVVAVVLIFVVFPRKVEEGHKIPAMTVVNIPPPPPPPPTPPPPPPPQEQKMVEQQPVKDMLNMKEDDQMKATDRASDSFGLTGSANGNGTGGGGRWGWYAAGVQAAIKNALSTNPKTKNASLGVQVRVWPDAAGKIVRVVLVDSTGDKAVDAAIENEVLNGLQLSQPPPDMPKPIVLRLARR